MDRVCHGCQRCHVHLHRPQEKFPVTTLLRAIGYGTDGRIILDLFGLSEEVEAVKPSLKRLMPVSKLAARVLKPGRKILWTKTQTRVVSIDRNEVLLERDHVIEEEDGHHRWSPGTKSIICTGTM